MSTPTHKRTGSPRLKNVPYPTSAGRTVDAHMLESAINNHIAVPHWNIGRGEEDPAKSEYIDGLLAKLRRKEQ